VVAAMVVVVSVMVVVPPVPDEPHDRFAPNQRPCLFPPPPPDRFRTSRAPLPHSSAPCPVGKFVACFALGSHSFFFFYLLCPSSLFWSRGDKYAR
jgi:hypothetical protein